MAGFVGSLFVAVRKQDVSKVEVAADSFNQAIIGVKSRSELGPMPCLGLGAGLGGDAILFGLPLGRKLPGGLADPRSVDRIAADGGDIVQSEPAVRTARQIEEGRCVAFARIEHA